MYSETPSVRRVARILGVSQGRVKRAIDLDAQPIVDWGYKAPYDRRQSLGGHSPALPKNDAEVKVEFWPTGWPICSSLQNPMPAT